jgi:hypothetical protein
MKLRHKPTHKRYIKAHETRQHESEIDRNSTIHESDTTAHQQKEHFSGKPLLSRLVKLVKHPQKGSYPF